MARTPFKVEVLTPDGEVFNDEVEMVSTRTTLGQIGVLANHAPLLATLEPTELRIYKTESEIVRFAQGEGYLQVGGNHAMLLIQDAIAPEELNASELRERLSEAERELEQAGDDTERRRVAERERKRHEAFIRISEGGNA
jgi:F-type H+-transporting ATPase subunit epsilon